MGREVSNDWKLFRLVFVAAAHFANEAQLQEPVAL
jgi:hypothetical protein